MKQYERYERYKPSGIEWIREIPEHWEVKRVKFNSYIKARVGWHGLTSSEYQIDGPYLVTGTDFEKGKINWDTCYHVGLGRYEEDPFIQLKEDDLLITKDGTIGKVAVVKNLPGKATLNSGVFVIRPTNEDYLTNYFFWALQSIVFSEFIKYHTKGSTINHLYQDTFQNLPLLLPSVKEQTIIANYLDRKTAQIDDLIAKKQSLIDLLNEEKTTIINQGLTKGLNPNAPMKESGLPWLGKMPSHWEAIRLKWISKINPSKGASNFNKDSNDLVTFLPMEKVFEDGSFDNSTKKAISELWNGFTYFEEGDVIVAKITPCFENGKGALLEKLGSQIGFGSTEFHVLRATEKILRKFLFYLTRTKRFKSLGEALMYGAAGQKRVPNSFLEEFILGLPPIEEQHEIIDYVDKSKVRIETAVSKIQREVEIVQEYRTALISEAVTGKIDVRGATLV